jgi:2,3-bisphosphoglycerate-independent phosphoglycerate mutase
MDRDQRWERVKKAYDLLVNGMGSSNHDFSAEALQRAMSEGITDEFIAPFLKTMDRRTYH